MQIRLLLAWGADFSNGGLSMVRTVVLLLAAVSVWIGSPVAADSFPELPGDFSKVARPGALQGDAHVPGHTDAYLRELRGEFTNSIGMTFRYVRPGSFLMGSDGSEGQADEAPVHVVSIPSGFSLGTCEVTQRQWEAVMGYNPSLFKQPDHPVEKVAWIEVQTFLRKLNELEGTDRYCLPTEAEWEYACRAGTTSPFYWGAEFDPDCAWCRENSDGTTHPVGSAKPNDWGFYDMAGNVSEWCADIYANYPGSSLPPAAVDDHPAPVVRGGSWNASPASLRSANRSRLWEKYRLSYTGFRVKAKQ